MKKNLLLLVISFGILSFKTPKEDNLQILKTKLQITIRNDLGNLESGAKVILYKTQEDYDASKNPVGEAKLTDAKGKVTFDNLEPIAYFVNAEKDKKNNFGAGVATARLAPKKLNKITIVISE